MSNMTEINIASAASGARRDVDIESARINLRQAQEALAALGYGLSEHLDAAGAIDGVWGKQTREAVVQFQADNNLERTGQLDEETIDALLGAEAEGRRIESPLADDEGGAQAAAILNQGVHESFSEVMDSIEVMDDDLNEGC